MPSRYEELFGGEYVGRPRREEAPTGVTTGDPKVTVRARRRATRVLKALYKEQFEDLMREEINHLIQSE